MIGSIELSGGRVAEVETGCKLQSLIIGGEVVEGVIF